MRCRWIALCCLVAGLAAAPDAASAGSMRVRYALSPILFLNPSSTFVPDFRGGYVELLYQATGTAPPGATSGNFHALPGPVSLVGGTLFAIQTFLNPPTGMAISAERFQLQLHFQQAAGTLRPTGTLELMQIPAIGSGSLECRGACPGIGQGVFPIPVNNPLHFDWTAPGHLVGTALHADALAPHDFLVGSQSGFRVIEATEIQRLFVPEPGALPMTASGLALLAGLAAWRRKRP